MNQDIKVYRGQYWSKELAIHYAMYCNTIQLTDAQKELLFTNLREKENVDLKHVFMYWTCIYHKVPKTYVADFLGMNHSSVCYGVDRITRLLCVKDKDIINITSKLI